MTKRRQQPVPVPVGSSKQKQIDDELGLFGPVDEEEAARWAAAEEQPRKRMWRPNWRPLTGATRALR